MSDHPAGKLPTFSPGSLGAQESYLRDQEDDMPTVLATYTLQLIGPKGNAQTGTTGPVGLLGRPFSEWLRETEENLTDLLPPNYSVRIREWDEEETPNERS